MFAWTSARIIGIAALACLVPAVVLSQSPFLVKDINPTLNPPPYPAFGPMYGGVVYNGYLFFSRSDSTSGGEELWRTDGTVGGTVRVKDIAYGPSGSLAHHLMVVNGTIYFIANDPATGFELWKSDGTAEGTVLVKDVRPGVVTFPSHLANANGTLFFSVFDGITTELWKSDGTASGTVFVKTINLGLAYDDITQFTAIGGTIYFSASSGGSDYELWKSDGTASGTVLVKDIRPAGPSNPSQMTNVNGTLFFAANDGTTGPELWKSDGTAAGTVLVKDIQPGASGSSIAPFAAVGGSLYFSANDGASGAELWKCDGTTPGTVLVKDIAPGGSSASPANPIVIGGTLYFNANDGVSGTELWKSDGTEAGTVLVKDIAAGAASSNAVPIGSLSGLVYLSADDGAAGTELWASDGTSAGTTLIKDILPGIASSYPYFALDRNGSLMFWATNGSASTYHDDLWKTDGTAVGTVQVNTTTAAAFPLDLVNMDGVAYFRASDATAGSELWRSDGTAAGTSMVKDIYGGPGSSAPMGFVVVGQSLFFNAATPSNGLWKSDGTAAGTVLVKQLNALRITRSGTLVFFVASDGTHGLELWKSDGTADGTVLVKDIAPGNASSTPENLVDVNGTLFFRANDGTTGRELWKSDGTAGGTVLVEDIDPEFESFPDYLTNMNGVLYFAAGIGGTYGRELWRSDGTEAGTSVVKDINPGGGPFASNPADLTVVGSVLYFRAADGATGNELWKSDGTTAGTVLVKDIWPGSQSGGPSKFASVNGVLFFAADIPTIGRELWKSDGTAAGTVLVKDIDPGYHAVQVVYPTNANGTLYFWATDDVSGIELWRSDGTSAGTVLVGDMVRGASSSNPLGMALVCPNLLFSVDNGRVGSEVFAVQLPGASPGVGYADLDGDGYGSGSPTSMCPGTPGYAASNTDCNDRDPTIHPGALETVCNGIDNDCSGTPDEDVACVCVVHAPGLAGWWRGNGTTLDAATENYGIPFGGVTYAAGRVGQAFSLDGLDDYVGSLGDAFSYAFIENTGIFTIEAWINLDVDPVTQQAITASTGSSTGKGHFFIWDNGGSRRRLRLGLMKAIDGAPVIDSSSPDQVITTDGWHHVAAVGNGTTITFYVDGVGHAGTGTMTFKPGGPSNQAPDIGRCPPANDCMFNGQIDEVAIYDRALSASEVGAIYTSGGNGMCGTGCTQSIPGLVGWWPAAGDGNDRSTSTHHADAALVSFAPGRVGQAFSFNGTTAYVANLGDATSYSWIENTGVFTIDAWINLNSVSALTQQAITASTGTSTEKGHFFIWENSAGEQKLRLGLMKGIDGVPVIESSSPNQVITTGGWHHVAAVGDGATVIFYVDGTAYAGTGTMSAKPSGGSTRAVDIGRCPAAVPQCLFNGLIDEVQIFVRALSAQEIQSIYAAGSSGMCGLGLATAVEEKPEPAPTPSFALAQPWPNPADRSATISFRTPSAGPVRAEVFDVSGRRVATLIDRGSLPAGEHRLAWDCRDRAGRRAAAGIYFVRVRAANATAVRKIVLVRR